MTLARAAVLLAVASLSCLLLSSPAASASVGAEVAGGAAHRNIERIAGSAGDVLEDNPVGRLKVFVYDLPSKYNKRTVTKDPRCLSHMFAAEIFMHRFLLSSAVRTLNPEEADWFYVPVYTTCDLTPAGLPLPFKSPRMMRSAIQFISNKWPFWNKTDGADHFFVVPHDFGACFHYQEEKAIERGILPMLRRATLVQTFGQKNHVCLKEGSIIIPPYAPPQKMQAHLIPPDTPRSIFVYFRGLFYDNGNDPEEVPELHCGRTSRIILCLISPLITLPLTMKICSVQSSACAH
ncbi:unnamed protein product [Urochloa decumbens]|uniref:Exostosin GT47 domain-containing protein n=1 Tax=Urochloa decumbens TaxID=240449 RepID=A0ABC9A0X1_9POAL